MPHSARSRAGFAATVLLGACAWAQPETGAQDAAQHWSEKQYGYVASNESLRSLLYDFGTSLGLPVIVSARITEVVDDRIPVLPAEQFLAELHTRFGVIWVYDGATLYLYDATETVSETVGLPFARRDAFQATVDGGGVRGVPLNWVFLPAENSLQLSGPPRFVEWAVEVAGQLADGHGMSPLAEDESYAIRIFEVEYGYVDHLANNAAGAKAPIASLAEMVAKLMNVAHDSGIAGIGRDAPDGRPIPKLRGTGVIPVEDAPAAGAPVGGAPASPGVVTARGAGHEAFVVGDPRLNAIVVRDLVHRMPTYERLIAELDRPIDQIEIAISVLDVDASAAEQMRFAFESDSLRVNAGGDAAGNTAVYSQNAFDVEGIALRIQALRNSGRSRVLTRPSVTTLDNHEASFQNNRTFYVRLGGNDAESVDLAPVSYGWVVRIRPHVIYDGEGKRVQLAVHIEDGNRGGADLAVTGVPEVAQNVIQTQAVVREGNSLLIGGYTVREQTRFRQRIPLLGRIPVVGRMFSTRVDRDQSVARYFVITPTILPATISYEINTGFEGQPLDDLDAVTPVPATGGAGPAPAAEGPRDDGPRASPEAVPARMRWEDGPPEAGRLVAGGAPTLPDAELPLHAYPADYYAVQVIALSSAEGLETFVRANDLQHMLKVQRTDVADARFLLLEGVYPDLGAARAAARRLAGDDRFATPYVRPLGSLHAGEQVAQRPVTGGGAPR